VSSGSNGPVLNDSRWAVITKHLKLRDEARTHVEFQIMRYRESYLRWSEQWSKPDGEVSEYLGRVGATAKRLADLLEGMGNQEAVELLEARAGGNGLPFLKRQDLTAHVRELSDACARAPNQLSRTSRTAHLDDFIKEMDAILRQFSGQRVSRGKAVMSFLAAVCSVADEGLGTGAIEEAIKRLQGRGEIPTKKSGNPTAEIHR
jgi:hypothetical protein